MSKLKLKLIKYKDTVLIVDILHQCESLRCMGVIYEKNGYKVCSEGYPELSGNGLWINGELDSQDKRVPIHSYSTEYERDEMYEFILEAVKHINSDLETRVSGDCFQATIAE